MSLSITNFKILITILPTLLILFGTPLAIYLGKENIKQDNLMLLELPEWNFNFKIPKQKPKDDVDFKQLIAIKDPFITSTINKPMQEELSSINLSMIILNKRHKLCKINGKFYYEGESGPDFLVKKIEEKKVLIERFGRKKWLFL